MTVKLIRMWSGEDVIADLIKDEASSITITDPIVAVPSQQQGQIAFAPWSPLSQKLKSLQSILFIQLILNQILLNNIIQCMVRFQNQTRNLYSNGNT